MATLLIVLWILFLALAMGVFFGAPYLPILAGEQKKLLDELRLTPGQRIIDLGCGDGRLLVAAAKRGVFATGYEISPVLWLIAVIRSWPYRTLVEVKLGNFWRSVWPPADVIYLFLITRHMPHIEYELRARITQPTLVASHGFALPTKKPLKIFGATFLYRFP